MKTRQLTAILLSALFSAAAFVSCRPTPDEPIVNAGDDSVLNDKIAATAVPTPVSDEENLRTMYGFPLKLQEDDFVCVDEDVRFSFDAEVEVPDVKAAPVYEAQPSFFTADFIKNFLENLHPGVQFYEHKTVLTRTEVEEYIELYQKECSMSWDEFLDYYTNNKGWSEEDMRQYREQCEYCLEEYKKLLDTVPETAERIPADFTFHDLFGYYEYISPETAHSQLIHGSTLDDYNLGRKFIIVDGAADDGLTAFLEVWSRFEGDVSGGFTYRIGPLAPGADRPAWSGDDVITSLSAAQAEAVGSAFIEKMDLPYEMVMTSITTREDPATGDILSYSLVYRPSFGGIEMRDVPIDNDYDFVNAAEHITIKIEHDMVSCAEYECPHGITKTENENVSLMSFDEVLAAFKKQAAVEYTKNYVAPSEEGDSTIQNWHGFVNEVELVMVRIQKREGEYRFVPAWQFRGRYDQTNADGMVDGYFGKAFVYTFMTINAIDGTRISGLDVSQ